MMFKVGDKVKVVRSYDGPFKVGHIGTITLIATYANLCARIDGEWNFPIDTEVVYITHPKQIKLENK